MSIKQNGGVFGRNPTFNDVTIEGDLIINGEVFTGLDFQGSWNASTNTPSLASSTGTNGEFYIVSVAGTTDLNGITNWGIGDWAIFNGTAWQRVEGGADGNFNDVTVAGSLSLGDNVKANFGASDDLQIYHDGDASYIADTGTGTLNIKASGSIRLRGNDTDELLARFNENGSNQFYYDNSQKLATTTTGIDVTGTATMDELTVDGSGTIASFKRDAGTNGQLDLSFPAQVATLNASSSFAFQTAATERMKLTSTGLGIGTSSPARLLHVNSGTENLVARFESTDTATAIEFKDSTGTVTLETRNDFRFKSGSTINAIIDTGGNVGIGTATPDRLLHLNTGTTGAITPLMRLEGQFTSNTGNEGTAIEFITGSGGTEVGARIIATREAAGARGELRFCTGRENDSGFDNGNLIIKQSGNVTIPNGNLGIGVSATYSLDVADSAGGTLARFKDSGSSHNGIIIAGDVNAGWVGNSSSNTGEGIYYQNSSNRMRFYTNGQEAMILDSSQNVNIPAGNLSVADGSTTLARTNGAPLEVNRSNDGILAYFKSGGIVRGSISISGSTTAYNTSSDYRLKEDVQPMSGATDRLKELKPVNFAWKADGSRVDGFLAHEAQEVVPESVTGSKDAMQDEEYEVTPAVYEDVITPAVEAVEGVEAVEAVEAVAAVYDDEGLLVSEAIEAVEAVEGVDAVEAQAETTESVLVSEAVMATRSVPDYQGIDQSKLVPLLTAALQEAITKIESLTTRIETLEGQ